MSDNKNLRTAILAGGCFWCVESDLEKIPEVIEVVSGYSGGSSKEPNYENYSQGGHREAVRVTYDPVKVTYRELLKYFLRHIDPTDGEGSFSDRGVQYSPAIYYGMQEEKRVAEDILAEIERRGVFGRKLSVPVLPRRKFWLAEEYHQNYARKNKLRYGLYRKGSGRDHFAKRSGGE